MSKGKSKGAAHRESSSATKPAGGLALAAGWPVHEVLLYWPETSEQYLERLRNTPTHLCRLRYFGPGDRWSFGFYTYSNNRYELSLFPSGDFFGPAEEALRVAAGIYLSSR